MRDYPVPAKVVSAINGDGPLARRVRSTGTIDRAGLERAAWVDPGAPLGIWANKVIAAENAAILNKMLDQEKRLPLGVVDYEDEDMVTGLTLDGKIYTSEGWTTDGFDPGAELVELDEATVASVAEAITAGANGVILRAWYPLAVIGTGGSEAGDGGKSDIPEGATVVAVVDELDKSAVLELLAVAPGPVVYRRNDGSWNEDAGWLTQLRGVTPPPLVELEPTVASGVAEQVDESTKGEPFVPLGKKPVAASAWAEEHQRKADEVAIRLALVAASKAVAKAKGHAMGAENLKEYWTTGKGGLTKIRWGTPGSWRRCHRHLLKYLGPRAAGFCTNLGSRMGGKGVAWDVGGSSRRAAKKAAKKLT